jgi:predicted DNA-binding protein
VSDSDGNVVRRLEGPVSAGFHRVSWDLRFPPSTPVDLHPAVDLDNPFNAPDQGPMAAPGQYTAAIAKRVNGVMTPLGEPQTFATTPLKLASLPAQDAAASLAFQEKAARLQRAVTGAVRVVRETQSRLDYLFKALEETPKADPNLYTQALELQDRLQNLSVELNGDTTVSSRNEPTQTSISDMVGQVVTSNWTSSSAPTKTQQDTYSFAAERFAPVLADLHKLVEQDLRQLESSLEAAGGPWTPGRIPSWQPE